MSLLLRAQVCSLAATYGIVYNCAGPNCGTLQALPLKNLFCTSDGTTLWCSNQQSCDDSPFVDTFQVAIDGQSMVTEDYVVVNGTQFTQTLSTQLPPATPIATQSSSTLHARPSSTTTTAASLTPISKTPTKLSLIPTKAAHPMNYLRPRSQRPEVLRNIPTASLQRRAGINWLLELAKIPELSVAKILGTFDAVHAAASDPHEVFKSLEAAGAALAVAIQGAVLPAAENILLDIAEHRYEDAAKDSLQFVIETTLDATVVAGSPETGGADLPALLLTHAWAAVAVDLVFNVIEEVKKEEQASASPSNQPLTPSPSALAPTPESSQPPPPPPVTTPPAPYPTDQNTTLIVRDIKRRRIFQ